MARSRTRSGLSEPTWGETIRFILLVLTSWVWIAIPTYVVFSNKLDPWRNISFFIICELFGSTLIGYLYSLYRRQAMTERVLVIGAITFAYANLAHILWKGFELNWQIALLLGVLGSLEGADCYAKWLDIRYAIRL